jgi:hypothetical protein
MKVVNIFVKLKMLRVMQPELTPRRKRLAICDVGCYYQLFL